MDAFKHFLFHEWYFSIPMILMSLVAIALVVWRGLLNLNARTNMNEFMPLFQETLQKEGVEGAMRLCETESGVIPRLLYTAGLEASKQGISAMKRSMASVLELEILPQLNFLLAFILAIAKIATMVGLLGTVISMIGTFTSISAAKGGNASDVSNQAQSIGLALFATAMGLITAIPLVFAHVLFKDWISRFETSMKASAQRLIVLFQNAKPRQTVPTAQPARDRKEAVSERVRTQEPR